MALSSDTQTVTDQMGRTVAVPRQPQRIISLDPSLTELLFDLGLNEAIVGRTHFCVHPADRVKEKPSIGGPKKFRFGVIERLQPDLIIGNKEENYQEGIEQLAERYPVWMSDVFTLADALDMIRRLGQLVDRSEQADGMAAEIERRFNQLPRLSKPIRVGYFIWQKPYMVAGSQTFIDDMLARCGFVNAFAGEISSRYPEVSTEQISAAGLDAVLLSSEPFPFAEKHREAFRAEFGVPVHLVDGEMFSWIGSRLLLAANYFRELVAALGM